MLNNLILKILNLEVHPNCITGSKVKAILLNGWILPTGGASAMEGLQSMGLPRLVSVVAFSPLDNKFGQFSAALVLQVWRRRT